MTLTATGVSHRHSSVGGVNLNPNAVTKSVWIIQEQIMKGFSFQRFQDRISNQTTGNLEIWKSSNNIQISTE